MDSLFERQAILITRLAEACAELNSRVAILESQAKSPKDRPDDVLEEQDCPKCRRGQYCEDSKAIGSKTETDRNQVIEEVIRHIWKVGPPMLDGSPMSPSKFEWLFEQIRELQESNKTVDVRKEKRELCGHLGCKEDSFFKVNLCAKHAHGFIGWMQSNKTEEAAVSEGVDTPAMGSCEHEFESRYSNDGMFMGIAICSKCKAARRD